MDEVIVPAILAYREGELFANLSSIVDDIPLGLDMSPSSLESVLQK